MKNILITGGAGYIGSHMVHLLISKGYKPIVIDNFSTSNNKNIEKINANFNTKVEILDLDIKDWSSLSASKLENIDAVIHFAALKAVGESVEKPIEYYENNVEGTINLLKWMNSNKVGKLIFSSTAAVYGMTEKDPVKEDHPLNPISPYAKTKMIIEEILKDFQKAYGLNSVVLRYFNVAGNLDSGEIGDLQRDPQNLIPALIMSHLGYKPFKLKVFGTDYPTRDGTGVRDYIHVLDLVEAHLNALEYLNQNQGSHIFNLGTGKGTTVFEIIEAFEKVTGEKLDYETAQRREGDVVFSTCDATRALNKLQWKPERTIEEMIESMWKWYKNYYNGK